MVSKLKLEGYEHDINEVLLDIEDDEKESYLTIMIVECSTWPSYSHSEKLEDLL